MLGHEGCGEVVASARPEVCAGSRVTFSVTDVCGECEQCRAGPQQKCRAVMKARQCCHNNIYYKLYNLRAVRSHPARGGGRGSRLLLHPHSAGAGHAVGAGIDRYIYTYLKYLHIYSAAPARAGHRARHARQLRPGHHGGGPQVTRDTPETRDQSH